MAIICQNIGTISGSYSLLCGKLVRIYDMRPYYDTIDVLIEGQVSPQVSGAGNSFTIGNERFTIQLISKNVAAGTAQVQLTIADAYTPPPVAEATHYLDLYVKPYSWYSAGGAADEIVAKLGNINGAITNLFYNMGITDYRYVGTVVLTEPDKPGTVTIRIKLNQTAAMGIESMVAIPLAVWIAAIVAALLVIIIIIGVITGWKFTLAGVIGEITGKKYTDKEVVTIVYDDVVKKQLDECKKNYADPNAAAGCQKAVICGAANGLTDALELTGADCTSLGINEKVDICLDAYNADGNLVKYYECIGKIADDAGTKTKEKLPEGTDWTTIALLGLGVLAYVSMSGSK